MLLATASSGVARTSVPDDYGTGTPGCSSHGGYGGYGGYGGFDGGVGCATAAPRPRIYASPRSPRAGAEVALLVTSEGRGLTYEWDLDDDGAYDAGVSGNSDLSQVTHVFATPGTHTVRVRATDEDGRRGSAELDVAVHATNRAPSAAIHVTPSAPRVGSTIAVNATGFDSDGTIANIAYDLDANGTFESSPAPGTPVTTSFSTAGQRTLRARVSDDGGATATATTTIDVHADNLAPVVSLSLYPSAPRIGREVEIYAYAQDLDGIVAGYEFDLDGNGTYETDAGSSEWTTHRFAIAGSAEIGVRVTDDGGATSVARGSVQVTEDNAVPAVGLSASTTAAGLLLSAYSSDPDGTIVQIAWDLDGDQVYEDRVRTQTSFYDQFYLPTPPPGSYEYGVRVTDDDGGVRTSRRAVTVRAGAASPRIFVSSSPQPRVGEQVGFSVSSQQGVTFGWDLDDDGAFDDATGTSTQRGFAAAGIYEVRVQATGADGATAVGQVSVTISPPTGNLAPRVSLSSFPASPRVATSVSFSTSAGDADGTIAQVAWDLDSDGDFDDASGSFASRTFSTAGSYLISVRATDDDGAVGIQRVIVDVHVGNTPPSVTLLRNGFFFYDDEVAIGQSVSLFPSAETGDDSVVRFEWDTDEDGQFDDFVDTFATTRNVAFSTPGLHRVRVRAVDAGGAADIATYVQSVRDVAANRPPRPEIYSPAGVAPGKDVSFEAEVYDPDGDSVAVAWDLDDDGTFDDATGYVAVTTFTDPGVRNVRLQATDGRGAVATAVRSITVRAARVAPVIDTFETAASPRVGRSTPLYAYAYDPDGEDTTLTFDLDGDGAFDDTPAGESYLYLWTPATTAPVTIAVRATDSGGATSTKTLDVHPVDANLAPVAAIVQGSGPYVAGRDAWFYASAIDPDDRGAELQYAWDTDGDGQFDDQAAASVTLTLPSGSLSLGLRVTDADGAATTVRETFLVGTSPPTASFVISDSTPDEGVAVDFTSTSASGDSPIVAELWDLDDDGRFDDASGSSATHTFTSAGNVRVGLKVRDEDGDNAIVYTALRVRSPTAPVARFVALPSYPSTGEEVSFTSYSTDPQGDDDIASQAWDLDGDGEFDDADGPLAATTYDTSGWRTIRLRVRDEAGHESIARLSLYVYFDEAPTRPENDDFAAAATLSATVRERRGSTAAATAESGEPAHGPGGPGRSVWARYVATASGRVTFGTCGSDFDTVLAAYTGASLQTLTKVASDDDGGCSADTSRMSFDAVAGETYWIAVDGGSGAGGRYRLSLHTPAQPPAPPNDAIASASALGSINDVPGTTFGATKEPGEPAHAGDGGGHSVWYVVQGSGALRVDVCSARFDTLLAIYTRDAQGLHEVTSSDDSASCQATTRSSAEFTATAGVDYFVAVDGRAGASGEFRLRVRRAPANDNFAAATPFSGIASGSTALATAEIGEPGHAGSPPGRSVWYTITTFSTARQVVSTCSTSTTPTRIAVYEGTSVATLTAVVASGPVLGCGEGRGASVSWRPPNSAQHVYRIAVDEAGPGPAEFVLESGSAPPNDDRADAGYLYPENHSFLSTTRFATHEPGEPDHAGAGGAASVWYAMTAVRSTRHRIQTCDAATATDTILAVYTLNGGQLTEVAANDDSPACANGNQSRVEFDATANVTYYVVVDAQPSQQGAFRITTRARPDNDDRASARLLSGGESLYTAYHGAQLDLATKEPGEPAHAGNAGGHSVWYRWTAPAGGPIRIDTCNSSVDTLLAVYSVSAGELTAVGANDDTPGCAWNGLGSSVVFTASAGVEYLIAVDGKNGVEGDSTLRMPPSNDHLAAAGVRGGEGFSANGELGLATTEPGEPGHRAAAAQRSVWFSWTPSRTAQATVDTCATSATFSPSLTATDPSMGTRVAVYTGTTMATLAAVTARARSACAAGSAPARLRFDATAGTTYRIAVDGGGTSTYQPYWISARLGPANDAFAAATNTGSGQTLSLSGTTFDAGLDEGEPDHAAAGGTTSVWYRWTAPRSATLNVDTCSSWPLDTAIGLYTQGGTGVGGLVEVGSADDASGCGPAGKGSRLRRHVVSGTTYWIAVTGHGDVEGSFELHLTLGPVNDDIANAATLFTGTNAGTTVHAGDEELEPDHGGTGGDHSVWYRFSGFDLRNTELRACPAGSSATPVLAVYAKTGLTLVPDGIAGTIVVGGRTCSVVTLRHLSGERHVAVDGAGPGVEGAFTLTLAFAPAHDDRARALTITGAGARSDETTTATREDGEPDHAGVAGGRSLWFRWTPAVSGPVTIDTCASALDTLLAVYEGAAVEPLVASDDAPGCGSGGSRVALTAQAGTQYLVAVDARDGAEGVFTLTFPPANDLFAAATGLSGALVSRTGSTVRAATQSGEPAHAGDPAAQSVWYSWTPPRSGRVSISTCLESSVPTRVALYGGTALEGLTPVAASGPVAGCDGGRGAKLRPRVVGGTPYRIAVDGAGDGDFTLQVALAPVNDDRADAIAVSAPALVSASTAFATEEEGEPSRAGHAAAASVWYRFDAPASGPVTIKTCSSAFATVLGVYDESLGAFHEVASAADAPGRCANRAALTFAATEGTRYLIAVDGHAGATGAFELAIGPPANDDMQDAAPLTGANASGVARTEAATTQDGEPADLTQFGRRTAWWSWTAPASGPIEINACGSSYQPVLAVYHGTPGALVRDAVASSGSGCAGRSRLTLTALAGRTYLIAVAGFGGGSARVQVGPPANDRFAGAQQLAGLDDSETGTIAGAAAEDGEPVHDPAAARRTIWYSWTAPDAGLLTLDTCGSPTPLYLAAYTGSSIGGLTRQTPQTPLRECPPAAAGRTRTFQAEAGVTYRIALDGAGDAAGPTSLNLRLQVDSVPPETTIDSAPPALTNSQQQTFEFSADEEGSTFECRLDGAAFAPCTSPVVRTGLAEDDHRFEVQATDEAGNTDPEPAAAEFTIDRTAPDVTIDSGPDEHGNDTTAQFTFSSPEAGTTFACSLDGETFEPCSSPASRDGLEDGPHGFTVQASDAATNAKTRTHLFAVDTIAPETTFTALPRDPTNALVPSISFSSEPMVTFACAVDSADLAPCASPLLLPGLGDGEHIVEVRATDRAGNAEDAPAQTRIRVDRTAPETTIAGPAAPVHDDPQFAFTPDEPDVSFACAVDDGSFAPCASPHTLALDGLDAAAHVLRVRATDAAGNVESPPAERQFTIANAEPLVEIDVSPSQGPAPLVVRAGIDAEDPDGDALRYAIDFGDGTTRSGDLPLGSRIQHAYDEAGDYEVRVTVSDRFGSAVLTRIVTVTPNRPPTAALDVTPEDGDAPLEVVATVSAADPDLAAGQALGYELDWGDGSAPVQGEHTGADVTLSHTFTTPATRTVRLTVSDPVQSATDEVVVRVRKVVPLVTVTAPAAGSVQRSTVDAAGSGDLDDGMLPEIDVRAYLDDAAGDPVARVETTLDASGRWEAQLQGLPSGTVVLVAEQRDDRGAVGRSSPRSFTVDAAAPTPAVTSGRATAAPDVIRGTSDEDGTLELSAWPGSDIAGTPARQRTVPVAGGRWQASFEPVLTPGLWTVQLRQSDPVGNVGTVVEEITVVELEPVIDAPTVVVAGREATFDAQASLPRTGIESYEWDFGDGDGDEGAVTTHAYDAPGRRTVTLTVVRGEARRTARHELEVVEPPAGGGVTVAVVDGATGERLSGANVAYVGPDGLSTNAVTGATGVAELAGLPDGDATVHAFAPGFLPASSSTKVAGGRGSVEIVLPPGTAVSSSLDQRQLTPEEAEDAGVDITDPANRNVIEFTGFLNYQRIPECRDGIDNSDEDGRIDFPADPGCQSRHDISEGDADCDNRRDDDGDERTDYPSDPGCDSIFDPSEQDPVRGYVGKGTLYIRGGGGGWWGGWSCTTNTCRAGNGSSVTVRTVEGQQILQWLIVSGRASALKEMYAVTLRVDNLAGASFPLRDGVAHLDLPPGLGLPALHGQPQPATASVADIPGGGSVSQQWIVRGDRRGEYDLSATYDGRLQPFDAPVTTTSRLAEPLRVWGADGLKVILRAPREQLRQNRPSTLRVGLRNTSPVRLYNVAVELDPDLGGALWEPRPLLQQEHDALEPGEVWMAERPIQLIPDADSEAALDLERSYVVQTAGDGSQSSGEVEAGDSLPAGAMKLVPRGSELVLDWEAVPGAAGYRVFKTRKERDTPFPAEPEPNTPFHADAAVTPGADGLIPADTTTTAVPGAAGDESLWAVSAIVDGREQLRTSAAISRPGEAEFPKVTATVDDCLSESPDVVFTAEDPYGLLRTLDAQVNGVAVQRTLTGRSGTATERHQVARKIGQPVGVTAVITSQIPGLEPVTSRRMTTVLCGVAEQPKIEIDDRGLNCSDGRGHVVLKISDDKVDLEEAVYLLGEDGLVRIAGLSGRSGEHTIAFGLGGSDYTLRRGGAFIRAAARNTDGIAGPVATKALCPGYGFGDEPPDEPDPPEKATGTILPDPPSSVPGCSETKLTLPMPGVTGGLTFGAGCIHRPKSGGGRVTAIENGTVTSGSVKVSDDVTLNGLGLRHTDPGLAREVGEYRADYLKRRRADFLEELERLAGKARTGSICAALTDRFGGVIVEQAADGGRSICFNGIWQLALSDQLAIPIARDFAFDLKRGSRQLGPAQRTGGQLFGLSLKQFSLEHRAPNGLAVTAEVGVASWEGLSFGVEIESDATSGLKLASARGGFEGAEIGPFAGSANVGLLVIRNPAGLEYLWGGDVTGTVGKGPSFLTNVTLRGGITFRSRDGKPADVDRFHLEADSTVLRAAPKGPIGIDKLGLIIGGSDQGAGFAVDKIGLNVGIAGPSVPVLAGVLLKGELAGIYKSNLNYADAIRVDGSINLVGAPGAVGQVTMHTNGLADFSGKARTVFGPGGLPLLTLDVQGGGWFNSREYWQVDLAGRIGTEGIVDVDVNGELRVSPTGIGACAKIPVFPDVGANFLWNGDLRPGCNLGELVVKAPGEDLFVSGAASATARAAAAGTQEVAVPAGQDAAAISLWGDGRPVTGVLRAPGGAEIALTGSTTFGVRHQVWVSRRTGQTLVVLSRPAPGSWTFAADGSSPRLTKVGRALEHVPPRVRATVIRRRDGRLVVRWSAGRLAGLRLALLEKGRDGTKRILETTRAAGSRVFRPAAGRRARRQIRFTLSRGGVPVADGVAASYLYRGLPRPGRSSKVRAKARRRGLAISWNAVRGASQYRVVVRGPDGRSRVFVRGSRKRRAVTFALAAPGRWRVSVIAVNAVGSPGPARRTVATVRRP